MTKSHALVLLVVAVLAGGGGWFLGRSSARARVSELEAEVSTLSGRVREQEARLEFDRVGAESPPIATVEFPEPEPAPADPAAPAAAPEAAAGPSLDAEHRLRRIRELETTVDGWFARHEGDKALAALKELAALAPEGRDAAMSLAVRINEDVNGDGRLGLSMMVFYTSLGDPAVRDLMTWSLENPSTPEFRAMSAYSLPWTLPPEETISRFSKTLDTERNLDVQRALVWNLARMKNAKADAALLEMLKDPEHAAGVRAFVAMEIADGKNPAIEETLRDLSISEPDTEVRAAAETALRILKPPATGFLVTGTVPGSQAAVAGLAAGDILVSYGGRAIESLDQLRAAADQAGGSEAVDVVVVRGHERVTLRLRPGKMGVYGREVKEATDR